jgi:DNA-binding transcriptional ArsR family regulator
MPRKKKRASKPLLNHRHMYALAKEERVRIFAIFCERVASPIEVSKELEMPVSYIGYHVKVLLECRLIVLEDEVQRRGAIEHFYRAVTPTLIPPGSWKDLPPAVRECISANILQEFFDDASAAIKAGVFDDPPGELSWIPLVLDAKGIEEFGELARGFLESVLDLQAKASKRLAKAKRGASKAKTATVFLATFLSARNPLDGKKASATKRR